MRYKLINIQYGGKYNIQTSPKNYNLHSLFPTNILLLYYSTSSNIIKKLGDDYLLYLYITQPTLKITLNSNNEKIYNLIKKYDIKKVLPYAFNSLICYDWFDKIKTYKLINPSDNIFIIAKNGFALDTIIYYQKYANYNFNPNNITCYLVNYNDKYDDSFTVNLLKKNKIKYNNYTQPLNTIILDTQINFAFIDINMIIPKLSIIRQNFDIQAIIATLCMVFKNLSIGGNIYIYSPVHTNIHTYQFYAYIKTFFDKSLTLFDNIVDSLLHQFDHTILIGYKGNIDLSFLTTIRDKYYECDPNDGLNYEIVNENESKLLNINYKSPNPPKCYVNQIVNIDVMDDYKEYCKQVKQMYKQQIIKLQELHSISLNQTSIPERIEQNMIYGIKYFKSIGIPLVDWLTDDNKFNNYFYDTIIRSINSKTDPYVGQFKQKCIEKLVLTSKLDFYYKTHIDNIYKISESVYQYLEDTDINPIERYFNNRQKTLQKFLLDTYNINIANHLVNRAWIKLYELYFETNYFDNLPTDIKAFHICEAPGNFINCSMYYTKKLNKTYNWNSQSWKEGDIWDQYGFIRQTSDRWDFGPNDTGNIMDLDNFMYYYKKYKGVDTLVGDCGIPYGTATNKSLSLYQLVYGLIMPKVGGNFVIKTFATQYNMQFMSLLNIALCYFDKLFIFRSSQNIWSPEIYIVGIGKHKFDEDILVDMIKKLEDDIVVYPIKKINPEFGLEYEYHTQNVINMYVEIKKFFVYLAKHPNEFKKEKPKLDELLYSRNKIWLAKYMGPDYKQKYDTWIEKNKSI